MTSQDYINIAKENPERHNDYPGYVYIGPGSDADKHNQFFEYHDIYSAFEEDGPLISGWNGGGELSTYYVQRAVWEKRVGVNFNAIMKIPLITLQGIKQQLAEAKKLVGKTVRGTGEGCVPGRVSKVELSIDHPLSTISTEKYYKDNGYVIGVYYNGFVSPHTRVKVVPEKIVVKNVDGEEYTGQYDKHTDIWKFGCAPIAGGLIRDLAAVAKEYSDRRTSITSVTIGKGIFPVETIKKMVEIQKQ